ncbi:hypothetical protein BBK82_28900 [Lentzea guizhouensis]|uniref:Uncharacterized protein n=1 Tax=Lentzea guizhouensis TaxID=1586287 RepID=A0A1B2HP29_9PSEU|nr:hypothetical protein [Lentzea guizhouensis]ANZ39470.1 hypothetical protein BBK82_28900 [Lentzea guizhouensis]
MVVFECVACGAALTVPVAQVDFPDHGHDSVGNGVLHMPALVEPGTWAAGPGWIAIAPGDVRGVSWLPDRLAGDCCGVTGWEGPNLACACGAEVATRVSDCSVWAVVWLEPAAVRAVGEPDAVVRWEELDWESTPLVGGEDEWWRDRMGNAAGVALAGVLVAAGTARVVAADGPVADTFQRALDELLPAEAPVKALGVAGPGVVAEADVLLVPRHPQTSEVWPASGTVVPIGAELWRWLAREHEQPVVPATGGRWEPYLSDDPLPRRPKRVEPGRFAMEGALRRLGRSVPRPSR